MATLVVAALTVLALIAGSTPAQAARCEWSPRSGAVVEVTNNVPIVVERSMYWDSNGLTFSGGTNATGIALSPAAGKP